MGYLSQEPQLDESKDVRANVMEGVAKKQHSSTASRNRHNYSDETADEMAKLQDEIEARGFGLDSKVDQAMDALRLSRWRRAIATLSGGERRRVALCKLLLDAPDNFAARTNPPTIWTRNRWNGWNIRCATIRAA